MTRDKVLLKAAHLKELMTLHWKKHQEAMQICLHIWNVIPSQIIMIIKCIELIWYYEQGMPFYCSK